MSDSFYFGGSSPSVSSHSVSLTGLTAGTVYSYQISAKAWCGSSVAYSGQFYTTSSGGGSCPISTISVSNVQYSYSGTSNSESFTWTNPTGLLFALTVSLVYGTTTALGSSGTVSGSSGSISGLSPGTTYYYSVEPYASCYSATYTSGSFTTLPLSISGVSIAADTSAGTSSTVSWTDTPSAATDTFAWGTSSGSYPNSVTPSNHQAQITGLTVHTTYYFQLCASFSGSSTCDTGVFHTTDISVQKSYDYEFPSPSFSTCAGSTSTSMTLNAATTFPGDIVYSQTNATNYHATNTNLGLGFSYSALGSSSIGCWPWSLGVESTRVDLWAIDSTNANDNFKWLQSTNNLQTSTTSGGSATVSWSINAGGSWSSASFGLGLSVNPASGPSWGVTPNNSVTNGPSAAVDYLGYFNFNWPMQIQTGFTVFWNMLVNDQLAQYQYLNDISFSVEYTYQVAEFNGAWWGNTVSYSVSFTVGDCFVGSGTTYTLSNQCTDIQQGTAVEP